MPIITANFENVDIAELALINLRRKGVTVKAAQFSTPRKPNRPGGLFPYAFSNSVGSYAPSAYDSIEARNAYDTRAADVTLQVSVHRAEQRRAEALLVSNAASELVISN